MKKLVIGNLVCIVLILVSQIAQLIITVNKSLILNSSESYFEILVKKDLVSLLPYFTFFLSLAALIYSLKMYSDSRK